MFNPHLLTVRVHADKNLYHGYNTMYTQCRSGPAFTIDLESDLMEDEKKQVVMRESYDDSTEDSISRLDDFIHVASQRSTLWTTSWRHQWKLDLHVC